MVPALVTVPAMPLMLHDDDLAGDGCTELVIDRAASAALDHDRVVAADTARVDDRAAGVEHHASSKRRRSDGAQVGQRPRLRGGAEPGGAKAKRRRRAIEVE